jgi:UDP-glucose 4-epimerase
MFPGRRAPFYLASKITQEIFAEHWRVARGLHVACLRLGSVYGVGQETGVLTQWARAMIHGQTVRISNGGVFGADFVTRDDVVRALVSTLRTGVAGAINIGGGVRYSLRQIASMLLEVSGAQASLLDIEAAHDECDVGFPALNISRAKRDLRFEPTPIRSGLTSLVSWLKDEDAAKS